MWILAELTRVTGVTDDHLREAGPSRWQFARDRMAGQKEEKKEKEEKEKKEKKKLLHTDQTKVQEVLADPPQKRDKKVRLAYLDPVAGGPMVAVAYFAPSDFFLSNHRKNMLQNNRMNTQPFKNSAQNNFWPKKLWNILDIQDTSGTYSQSLFVFSDDPFRRFLKSFDFESDLKKTFDDPKLFHKIVSINDSQV